MFFPVRFFCVTAAALILSLASGGNIAFAAPAQAAFTASAAPPPLPAYSQSTLPAPGYLWTPGYWALSREGYYWTPGSWVRPPAADLIWTPGYWAWNASNHDYVFHSGYWAPKVGYYGGIDYRFGYTGHGYHGGYWRNHEFVYNRVVNDLGHAHVATYANQVYAPATRVSYNGGPGGTTAKPTPAELATARERRVGPTHEQIQSRRTASRIPSQRYSENKGAPPIGAIARANDYRGADTSLPVMHSVAGAEAHRNGPFVNHALGESSKEAQSPPHGPVAPTGQVPNFAQHPVSIHSPTTAGNPGSSQRPSAEPAKPAP